MKKLLPIFVLSIIAFNCPAQKSDSVQRIFTSLTFQKNDAEEAMNFYVSLFDNSKIIKVQQF